jgi:hypothetical protein
MQTDTEQRMAAVAGVCFLLYPAIRPFADEDSLAGAEAFASGAWVIAHLLAVLAFILFFARIARACSAAPDAPCPIIRSR